MVIFHSYVSLPEGILCFGCFIGDFSQEKTPLDKPTNHRFFDIPKGLQEPFGSAIAVVGIIDLRHEK